MKLEINRRVYNFVKEKFSCKYPDYVDNFDMLFNKYLNIIPFKINENWFDKKIVDCKNSKEAEMIHFILRSVAEYYMIQVFCAMKIDLNDPNIMDENGGTPYRLVKMWCGKNIEDDRELMSGRFHKPIRIAKFPNQNKEAFPIVKEVELTAVCSHHIAPFSTRFSENAKIIIAYIPNKFVLGISKLQRLVRFVAQRGWLQEDLTKAIYDKISEAAKTESVYVKLQNLKHSCEFLRGALSEGDGFTTEYYGGLFKDNKEILNYVRNYRS